MGELPVYLRVDRHVLAIVNPARRADVQVLGLEDDVGGFSEQLERGAIHIVPSHAACGER